MVKGTRLREGLRRYALPELFDPLLRGQLRSWGSVLVLAVCVATLAVWIAQGSPSLRSLITVLAKTSAFLAITLLALNFMTSVRWSLLEDLFGGLDRQYKVHRAVGMLTLFFAVFHLAFLTLDRIPAWSRVLSLYVPGLNLPITWGIFSLFALSVLLALTLFPRLSYEAWLLTHRLMVLPLLLAIWHALDAGSDIQRYPVLMYWVLLIGGLGVASYLFTLVLYRYVGPRRSMMVVRVNRLPDLTEIYLRPTGKGLTFHPGQFVFVRFPRLTKGRGMWPFSISSHPAEDTVRLSIKMQGDFTERQAPLLQEGDDAVVMGPYGKFGERYLEHKRDMVWIAGGIGITPFLSMAKNEAANPIGRKVDLIWSHRSVEEAPYHDEIVKEAEKSGELRYHPWPSGEKGRLDAERIAELLGGAENLRGRIFFLCGPLPMMEDLSRQLLAAEVRARDIVFEDFNLL